MCYDALFTFLKYNLTANMIRSYKSRPSFVQGFYLVLCLRYNLLLRVSLQNYGGNKDADRDTIPFLIV